MDQENKKGPGRPTKFNETIRDKIMALAGANKTDVEIAEAVGVTERTLNIWKKTKGPQFFQSLKDAKNIADELVEASLFRKAVGYTHKEEKVFCSEGEIITHTVDKHYAPDTTAGIFWLKNRKSQEWRDKVEVGVEDIEEMNFGD